MKHNKISDNLSPLRGIVPPMVTPLNVDHSLDIAGLEKLINHMLEGGVKGLFILGTTGEGPSLPYPLRHQIIDETCRIVASRVPVLVCITDTIFSESVRLAKKAHEAGAAAVVAAPPYYFPLNDTDLYQYIEQLSAALPLPLLMYNIPGCTKTAFSHETILKAAQLPNVIGYKDSTCDMLAFHRLHPLLETSFTQLIGPEELMGEFVLMGGHGGVNGGANVFPNLYTALYQAAVQKDVEQVVELQNKVGKISDSLYGLNGQPGSSVIHGIKLSLSVLGICQEHMAPPLQQLGQEAKRKVENFLDGFNFSVL